MKRSLINGLILALLIFAGAVAAYGQRPTGAAAAKTAAPAVYGQRAELLRQLDQVESKLVALAQAVPQEKYNWRPNEGVRSVSEVYMHVADGTSRLLRNLDFEPPAVLDDDNLESITDKAKVIELLKLSLENVRHAINSTPEARMLRTVTFLGKKTTARDAFYTIIMHMHEHLGQSIAYARINNIVPPWTANEASQPGNSNMK